MEKVYRLLDWLDMVQAVDWLQDLTKTRISGAALLQLCGAGQCSVYLNCDGRSVELETGDDWPPFCQATGLGMSKVRTALKFMDNSSVIDLFGPVLVSSTGVKIEQGYFLLANGYDSPQPRFKPSDIEALAAQMNGVKEQPSTAEVEDLRQQLEQERAKREDAEAKLAEQQNSQRIDSEIFKTTEGYTGFLLDELQQERGARKALDQRASQAEAQVAALRHEIEDIYSAQQAAERDAENEAYHRWIDEKSDRQPETRSTGLIFPYATRHLEAMRAAALEHWSEHDRSKPAPYGIQKKVQVFLAMRTGENSRKLIELAAAIKPDDLPKS